MRCINTSETGSGSALGCRSRQRLGRLPSCSAGFTLVELLAVVVIMVIMMGLLVMSMRQARGPAVQVAAAQVAGGLSLARQIAISKNTTTRFLIANSLGAGLPEEPFRYWTIVSSNRNVPGVWTMEKEWEPLPAGAVFLNIAGRDYSTVNWDQIPASAIGNPYEPKYGNSASGQEWQFFSVTTPNTAGISYPDDPDASSLTFPAGMPYISFKPSGGSAVTEVGNSRQVAVRVAEGSVDPSQRTINLQSVNNATYIETDNVLGKVIVRPRESYR